MKSESPGTEGGARRTSRLPFVVIALAAILLMVRLDEPQWHNEGGPPEYLWDECYLAFTSHRIVLGDPKVWTPHAKRISVLAFEPGDFTYSARYQWDHPPAATLFNAFFIRLFGFNEFGARIGSVIFGVATLIFTWRIARRMGLELLATLAVILLASDGVFFVCSRTGMSLIYFTALTTGALDAAHRFLTRGAKLSALYATGAFLGAAFAVKWFAAPLAAAIAVLCTVELVKVRKSEGRNGLALAFAHAAGAFVAVPLLVYVGAYAPYLVAWGHSFSDLIALHREIIFYHRHLVGPMPQVSPWYEWPWLAKPVVFISSLADEPNKTRLVECLGNPALSWLLVPSGIYAVVRLVRRRTLDGLIVPLGLFGLWVPWACLDRFTMSYFILPALPFAAIAIAMALDDAGRRWAGVTRYLAPAYATIAIALFAHFYPLLSATPVDIGHAGTNQYVWFSSWRP